MELQKIYHCDFVEVSFDSSNQWIYADWKGYQSDASVKEGCELILEALIQFNVSRVLNDNRRILGIWTGVAEWMACNWYPRMHKAGMKKFALVYSPSRLSQVSADAAMHLFDSEGHTVTGFFEENAAVSWLINTNSTSNRSNRMSEAEHR